MICLNVPEFAFCGACADTNAIEEITLRENIANLVIVFPSVLLTSFECSLALVLPRRYQAQKRTARTRNGNLSRFFTRQISSMRTTLRLTLRRRRGPWHTKTNTFGIGWDLFASTMRM